MEAACLAAGLLFTSPLAAWDSKGHNVVEALAYRTLVEGPTNETDGRASASTVLL